MSNGFIKVRVSERLPDKEGMYIVILYPAVPYLNEPINTITTDFLKMESEINRWQGTYEYWLEEINIEGNDIIY